MIVAGIDTSCDDTSVAVLEDQRILSNVISSQDAVHQQWGGVVPMLAKREHEDNFASVWKKSLQRARMTESDLDAIAVTIGPGLAPALEAGIRLAETTAHRLNLPLYAINHIEGHFLSACAQRRTGTGGLDLNTVEWPILGLIVSGGHTEMVLSQQFGHYEIIGETVDDAFGEAFDKVARMLGLGFPGGAVLADLAKRGNPRTYPLPIAMRQSGDLNVSYSGLKTASLRLIRELTNNDVIALNQQQILDVAASFQAAAVQTFTNKVQAALDQHPVQHVLLGGGAAVNLRLRQALREIVRARGAQLHLPFTSKLCQDNGAMIALAASLRAARHQLQPIPLDRRPQWRLNEITVDSHQ